MLKCWTKMVICLNGTDLSSQLPHKKAIIITLDENK